MATNGSGDGDKASDDPLIDPYLEWAVATNFAYLGGVSIKWFPVLLELETTAAEFWLRVERANVQDAIRVPRIYRNPPSDVEKTSFCTALFTRDALRALVTDPQSFESLRTLLPSIRRIELGSPVVSSFNPKSRLDTPDESRHSRS